MNSYMFDTNIFNAILDGSVDTHCFAGAIQCYATHVQFDELSRTSNEIRRAHLIQVFTRVVNETVATESLVLGVSRLGLARLGDSVLYTQIKTQLDLLNKQKANNAHDALIAETALHQHVTLVTHDRDLASVVVRLGGAVHDLTMVMKALPRLQTPTDDTKGL